MSRKLEGILQATIPNGSASKDTAFVKSTSKAPLISDRFPVLFIRWFPRPYCTNASWGSCQHDIFALSDHAGR